MRCLLLKERNTEWKCQSNHIPGRMRIWSAKRKLKKLTNICTVQKYSGQLNPEG